MPDPAMTHSQRKRAAILSAARTTFLRDGFTGASMDVVAAESGVSKQTVYAHFGNKDTLFVHIVAGMTQEIARQLPEAPAGIDTRDRVAAWLLDYGLRQLQAVLTPEIVQLRRLVIAEAERFPEIAQAFHDNGVQASIKLLAVAFDTFTRDDVFAIEHPERAASDFNWLLMGDPVNQAMMLGPGAIPNSRRLRAHTEHAVTVFLSAYR